MAYNKRNWKARQGTGLNFFSIDGATPVPIVNQPTTLTEAGDALSAGNLNDWEQRIKDGFDDADASIANVQGNLETYETTNDMRVAANSQDIQNIQNALSGTVIQEHVDSTQKNVKSILSADELLPWAILKRVGARSTQFNQLMKAINSTNYRVVDGTVTISDNYIKLESANAQVDEASNFSTIAGHKYLFCIFSKNGVAGARIQNFHESGVTKDHIVPTSSDYQYYGFIFTSTGVTDTINFNFTSYTSGSWEIKNAMLFDLTVMSLDSLTVDQFRAKFPASYYAPNDGDIYDVPPLSFLYRGTNQWNEKWKHWAWNTDGTHYDVSSFISSENKIRVIPNQKYYFLYPNTGHSMVIYVWDREGNVLVSGGIGTDWTMPANAYEMVIMLDGYSTDYNNDIMVCLYSVTDKTYRPANHRTIDTSFMAGKKYVNSSCYDYAENVYVNGILKRKNQTVVGSVDLSQISFSQFSGVYYANLLSYGFKVHGALMCDKYFKSDKNFAELGEGEISSNNVGFGDAPYIFIKDSNGTPTGTLYYELATLPDPTYGDPIPNIPCEDGSTIMANTPQTDIVNAIDVPSTIGYGTKIS